MGIGHADAHNEAGALAAMALLTMTVTYKPTFYYGRDILNGQNPAVAAPVNQKVGGEERGDVSVHSLWEKGYGCVLDI